MPSTSSIVARIFILGITLVGSLALSPLSAQDQKKSSAPSPTILGNPVPVDYRELRHKAEALEDSSCDGRDRGLYNTISVADFVGGQVKDIRIVRFDPKSKFVTNEERRATLKTVWQGEFRTASCFINWAEGASWSIEAVVEFYDGRRSELITDGSHIALQDHDGKGWFFRLLPAAQ